MDGTDIVLLGGVLTGANIVGGFASKLIDKGRGEGETARLVKEHDEKIARLTDKQGEHSSDIASLKTDGAVFRKVLERVEGDVSEIKADVKKLLTGRQEGK